LFEEAHDLFQQLTSAVLRSIEMDEFHFGLLKDSSYGWNETAL